MRLHLKGPHVGLKGEKKDMALLIRETERQAGLGLVGAGGSRGPHVVCEHQELMTAMPGGVGVPAHQPLPWFRSHLSSSGLLHLLFSFEGDFSFYFYFQLKKKFYGHIFD